MQRLFVGVLILWVTSLLATPSIAQVSGIKAKDPSLQAAIEAREKAVNDLNMADWSKFTADDFFRVNGDGTIRSRSEQVKALAGGTASSSVNPIVIERIQMFGPDAAVTAQRNQTGTNPRVTHFWVRQGGAWRVAAVVFTPNTGK